MALDYRRPYGWKLPLAIVATVAVLVAAGSALALLAIDDDASREARASVGDAPAPAAQKKPANKAAAAESKKESTEEPKAETKPAEAAGTATSWPAGERGFTVVVGSTEDRRSAAGFAREARAIDVPAGVLEADRYKGLGEGLWLVYAGQYEDRAEAERAVARHSKRYPGAYPQAVTPR